MEYGGRSAANEDVLQLIAAEVWLETNLKTIHADLKGLTRCCVVERIFLLGFIDH